MESFTAEYNFESRFFCDYQSLVGARRFHPLFSAAHGAARFNEINVLMWTRDAAHNKHAAVVNAGDSSDNVPGVAKIGHKRAQQLVEKYATVENIFVHAHTAMVCCLAC
jgi:5'-3' exonuclease, C-terminal SAM fold